MDIFLSSLSEIGVSIRQTWHILGYVWFLMLPPIFYFLFKILWLAHANDLHWASASWVLLEIIPPKNIEKSPKPIESLFVAFAGVEKGFSTYEKFVDGMFTDYMSLEMVSDEGTVHFYIRTMKKHRHLIEANLYAHYPDVEIMEVPDYVDNFPRFMPNSQWRIWGADVEMAKKHPAYPIRTYPTYEESITGTMIDPLAGVIEALGKLGPGQHGWIQWVIAPTSPDWSSTVGVELTDKLKGKEKKKENIVEKIIKDLTDVFGNIFNYLNGPVEFAAEKKKEEQPLDMRLSPMEREVLKAVEANLGKVQFSVKGRCLFVARRENFDMSIGVSAIWGAFKQFGDDNLNGFKPGKLKTSKHYDFFKQERLDYVQRKLYRRYKSRSRDGYTSVMSSEELATIFHLPDMNVLAPSMTRVEAKRGGAPSNLPIE